jgi:hypothetical protein
MPKRRFTEGMACRERPRVVRAGRRRYIVISVMITGWGLEIMEKEESACV